MTEKTKYAWITKEYTEGGKHVSIPTTRFQKSRWRLKDGEKVYLNITGDFWKENRDVPAHVLDWVFLENGSVEDIEKLQAEWGALDWLDVAKGEL